MQRQAPKIESLLSEKSVLVIEPNVNYRSSIRAFFTNMKIKDFRIVSSVRDAKVASLSLDIGLYICEWNLKVTNGIQFCREIRANPQSRNAAFLLLSVENLKDDVILASEVGIDGYLLKPFSYEEFQATVLQVLKARATPPSLNQTLNLAEQKLTDGDLEDAESLFCQALIENPMSARAFAGLGRIEAQRGNFEKCFNLFQSAIEVNPEYLEAIRSLLDIGLQTGKTQQMLPLAQYAQQLSPNNPRYHLILAQILLAESKYEDSERYFKQAIRLSPRLAESYKGLGKLYLIRDDYERAMKNFHKALDLEDQDVSLLNAIGLTYIRLGKYQEGVEKYLSALRLDPQNHQVLFNLGYANEKSGNYKQAYFYYNQALTQKPEFLKAKRRISNLRRLADDAM